MQRKIPAVFMRGGTSKAVFFHENHLPSDPKIRDRVIQAAYGSPDPNKRQIDGMGGAVSSTSKVAIISPSKDPDYDVNYNFGQVAVDKPMIDYQGNCGNIGQNFDGIPHRYRPVEGWNKNAQKILGEK